jgi:hypothetical protein
MLLHVFVCVLLFWESSRVQLRNQYDCMLYASCIFETQCWGKIIANLNAHHCPLPPRNMKYAFRVLKLSTEPIVLRVIFWTDNINNLLIKDGSAYYTPPIRTQPIKMMTWSQNQSAIQPTIYGEGKLYMMIFTAAAPYLCSHGNKRNN